MITDDDVNWEAIGETNMCKECPAMKHFNFIEPTPCPFWAKRQPCPVELGMSEVAP